MKTSVESLASGETEFDSSELTELGTASEETRGGFWGSSWDGGWGVRWP